MPTRRFQRLSAWCLYLWVAAAVILSVLPDEVFAARPNIVNAWTSYASHLPANLLVFQVHVSVDTMPVTSTTDHRARVGWTSTNVSMATGNCAGNMTSGTWVWSPTYTFPSTASDHTWTLYNFETGKTYGYKVLVGPDASSNPQYLSSCGLLPSAALVDGLNQFDLRVGYPSTTAPQSKYVLFDSEACDGDHYMVAVKADTTGANNPGQIVWYLNLDEVTGSSGVSSSGWRYQSGDATHSDRILVTLDKEKLYEIAMDGTVIASHNYESGGTFCSTSGASLGTGPCPHHDAFRDYTNDRIYALHAETSNVNAATAGPWTACGTTVPTGVPRLFVKDGFQIWDSAMTSVVTTQTFIDSYPTTFVPSAVSSIAGGSPYAGATSGCNSKYWDRNLKSGNAEWIDWIHVNAIAATNAPNGNRVIDLSMKAWDEVVRVRAITTAPSSGPVWTLTKNTVHSTLSMDRDPASLPDQSFADQHDVHATQTSATLPSGGIMLFDNTGGSLGARALLFRLVGSPQTAATMIKNWWLVDSSGATLPDCLTEGSAQEVPGSTDRVLAMCAPDRTALELTDPNGGTTLPALQIYLPTSDVCLVLDGTTSPTAISGWSRAYPTDHLGDY